MQNRAIFSLSIVFRLVLAMLIPIQVALSVGVINTDLYGFGMVWTLSGGLLEIRYFSILIGVLCSIPAVFFSVYLRRTSQKSYPAKAALLSTLLVFIAPLAEMVLSEKQYEWLIAPLTLSSPGFVPLGYSTALFIGFVILPSLGHIIRSSGHALLSYETISSLVVLIVGLFAPFVLLFNRGVYALDETILSSGFIALSSNLTGWTTESGFYFMNPTLINDLNPQLVPFYFVSVFRVAFVFLAILCILGRISRSKALFAGVVQEVVLIVTSILVNDSIPPRDYYSAGVVPIPFLFLMVLVVLLVQYRIRQPKTTSEEEYVTVPAMANIRYQWEEFKRKLTHRSE